MRIAISAESTIDLTKELLEQFDIHTVPFSVILGAESKYDGELSNQDLFNYVKETNQLPKTSAVNQFQYEEHFKALLNNYDAIIHISLSSEISSACRNAILAANEFDGKVFVIDSRSLSTGIALLALYARKLANQGIAPIDIVNQVKEKVNHVQASFVLHSLDYLYKGGRCSKLAMFGANLFHICPQIIVSDGKMDAGKKFRGKYFDVVSNYVDETLEEFNNPDLENVFITFPSLEDETNIVNMVKDKLVKRGFKNIYVTYAGGTIASHCGPDTIGILYFNN